MFEIEHNQRTFILPPSRLNKTLGYFFLQVEKKQLLNDTPDHGKD